MDRVPRQWQTYKYYDPRKILPKLHAVRMCVAVSNLDDKVKNLRTRKLQPEREAWDTAVFCYLLSQATGRQIHFAKTEESDYDAIFFWEVAETEYFAPVQMKELVPEHTNPDATLNELMKGLEKYVDSKDLVVGIKLNRRIRVEFDEIDTKQLSVGSIWLFGVTEPDESKWSLFEQDENNWRQHIFSLPGV